MSPLDKALLRDLWRQKTQVLAIMVVMALGVFILVMMDGLVSTLLDTRATYYERQRFADAYAPLVRAPKSVVSQMDVLDEVNHSEGRLVASAQIDTLLRVDEPPTAANITARLISLPDFGEPRLNTILLAEGRRPSREGTDEIVVLRAFVEAQNLALGDQIKIKIQGALHEFTIVGVAMSPEFLYVTAPGELAPDPKRFAAVWMNETALAAALRMEGAINEILFDLNPETKVTLALQAIDRVLEPFGSLGAYGMADQPSNRYLSEELSGLEISSAVVPPIFVAIAAFLLNMVVARMIEAERMQIGLLKAFGYTSLEVAAHYMKFILITAIGGAALGCVLGLISGTYLAAYFQVYFRFPFLVFTVDPATFAYSLFVSVAAGSVGGFVVLWRVFGMTPVESMRPPKPNDYSRSGQLFDLLKPLLDQSSRMVMRQIMRHKTKSVLSAFGLAMGMGLSLAMLGTMTGFEKAIETNFSVVDRSDATLTFTHPLSIEALGELERLPGVRMAEPQRHVAVMLKYGRRMHSGVLSGLVEQPFLGRVVDEGGVPISIRDDGISLSSALARKLDLAIGDILEVEIREGERKTISVPVVAISTTLLGSPAYMEIKALGRVLGATELMTNAKLLLDPARQAAVRALLIERPQVASLSLQSTIRAAIQDLMEQGAGATRYIMLWVSAIITFGITYNAARIAFSERAHDLASLEIIGMTKGEVSFILLGELGLVTLASLPLGTAIGFLLTDAIARGFSTDLYTISASVTPPSVALAALSVVFSAAVSAAFIIRDVNKMDIIKALKSRE